MTATDAPQDLLELDDVPARRCERRAVHVRLPVDRVLGHDPTVPAARDATALSSGASDGQSPIAGNESVRARPSRNVVVIVIVPVGKPPAYTIRNACAGPVGAIVRTSLGDANVR